VYAWSTRSRVLAMPSTRERARPGDKIARPLTEHPHRRLSSSTVQRIGVGAGAWTA
jgi:hypothetical protein